MRVQKTVADFARAASTAQQARVLWQLVLDYFHDHDIPMISYHHIPLAGATDKSEGTIISDGFPREWVCHYIKDKLARVDPFPAVALSVTEPFLWSDIDRLTPLVAEQTAFLEDFRSSGLGDGLVVQVFGPAGRNGCFGLGFGCDTFVLSAEDVCEMQCICQIAHLKYCEILAGRRKAHPVLTSREREVLEWVARGKSNTIIAELLGVSKHTVDSYMRRIYQKLEVGDRITAALRGVGSGLIRGTV